NGCVYCASVHSRHAATYSKREADVQRLLDEGVSADLGERWNAIVAASTALTATPIAFGPEHVERLRRAGLDDLAISDVIHAAAHEGAVTGGIRRQAGMIAGHEPCGVVAAVGSGITEKEARVGQRVMDHHYEGCGNCKHCRAGWTQMCLAGTVVYGSGGHGGHAKYMKVPVSTLVPLPDSLSFVTGAAISCGTGTAWGALKR